MLGIFRYSGGNEPGQPLIRPALRRATFPRGEGLAAAYPGDYIFLPKYAILIVTIQQRQRISRKQSFRCDHS